MLKRFLSILFLFTILSCQTAINVSFDTADGKVISKEFQKGIELTESDFPPVSIKDYVFEGWTVKGSDTLINFPFKVENDITFVAKVRELVYYKLAIGDTEENITKNFEVTDKVTWTVDDESKKYIYLRENKVYIIPTTEDKVVKLTREGGVEPKTYDFTIKAGTSIGTQGGKHRVVILGNNVYNEAVKNSIYSNVGANGEATTASDSALTNGGFLGGALYNHKWEATDSFLVKDYSVANAVLSLDNENSIYDKQKFTDCVNFKPDTLILNFGNDEISDLTYFEGDFKYLIKKFKNLKPTIKIYVTTPIILKKYTVAEKQKLEQIGTSIKNLAEINKDFSVIDLQTGFTADDYKSETELKDRSKVKMGEALLFAGDLFKDLEQIPFPTTDANKGIGADTNKGTIRNTNRFNNQKPNLSSNPDLIFVGDSITHWWNEDRNYGLDSFNTYFTNKGYKTINMGQASDTTADTMLKISQGLLGSTPNTINPKVAFLMIGTNNIGNPNTGYTGVCNSEQTAIGIKAIVDKIREFCPSAKIVVTKVLPTRQYYGMTRAKIELCNRMIEDMLKDYTNLSIIDIEEDLTLETGLPDAVIYNVNEPSRLHIINPAYVKWAEKLINEIPNYQNP